MSDDKKYCFLDRSARCNDFCKAWDDGECKLLKLVSTITDHLTRELVDEEIFGNQYFPPEVG